ncbi:N-formylglutamate amidohydrolase [Neotabrizicola sp. VNH66]|uniref:N-formylglutamate amidohydrolase n=1 Tax=Neotabrizicola sp. VNH66 TaxID=3400918 RepID=UPI003BFCD7AC
MTGLRTTTDSYHLTRPAEVSVPLVLSSPHSGQEYPADFLARSQLDRLAIRSSEDAFVDQLFGDAPAAGAPLLAARVPRAFLDLNRSAEELDPAVVEGIERTSHNPRISSGLGVVPRVVAGGRAIYSGKLSRVEADWRIQRYWHPWHRMLHMLIEETRARFGQAVLLDCHSMPHEAIEVQARAGSRPAEVVLGDRFGASAGRDVMDRVEAAFVAAGLRVARNSPFAGAYITQTYGRPSRNVHAIQVEIDRALYMDEARIEPRADFQLFRGRISDVIARIAGDLRQQNPLAAE